MRNMEAYLRPSLLWYMRRLTATQPTRSLVVVALTALEHPTVAVSALAAWQHAPVDGTTFGRRRRYRQ